jgi:hypothetical protein
LENSLPNWNISLAEACGRILAAFPLVAGKFLQKPASKSLLEMLKNNNKCYRKFSALPQKIFLQKSARKMYEIMTYLRDVSMLKNM